MESILYFQTEYLKNVGYFADLRGLEFVIRHQDFSKHLNSGTLDKKGSIKIFY